LRHARRDSWLGHRAAQGRNSTSVNSGTPRCPRDKGKSSFTNVTRELLYIYTDIDGDGDGDGTLEYVPLFDDALEGYFWDYDNNGLKVAQLRFYDCGTDPVTNISSCF
jgi:hypothetical protein